jgi:hypothetical protein
MAAVVGLYWQAALAADNKTTLTVYMVNESIAPPALPNMAKGRTEKMLSVAGISIQWRGGPPKGLLPVNAVIIEMVERMPKDLYPGALAFAMPYDRTHIKVFYDRVESAVHSNTVPALLAHVLAHEIAHVLQGISRHSNEGVMKAHWDANDYHVMQSKPLAFNQKDIDLIRLGLAAREEHALFSQPEHCKCRGDAGRALNPYRKPGSWNRPVGMKCR